MAAASYSSAGMARRPAKQRPSGLPGRVPAWLPYALILALGLLVHGRSAGFGFTYCDDVRILVEQQDRFDELSDLPQAFGRSFGHLYRPVLEATWILDAARGGADPAVYHRTNVAIHLAACCLALAALLALGIPRGTATLLALMFTVHPLTVQAVAWIPGRNDSLATLFVIWAFLHLARYAAGEGKAAHAGLHLLLFALALFTKESVALFPVAALAYLAWVRKVEPLWRRAAPLLAGWGLVLTLWWIARARALAGNPDAGEIELDYLINLVANGPALLALLGKLILPWKLSSLATFEAVSIGAGAAAVALIAILWIRGRGVEHGMARFGALWYLLFSTLPLLYRLPMAKDHFDYLEHRAHLPLFGFLVLLAALLPAFGISFRKRPALAAALLVLAALGIRSYAYAGWFRDPMTFWKNAIAAAPERANFHAVLGKLHADAKDWRAAEPCFRQAIALSRTSDPRNYKNLAVVYKELGQPEMSVPLYERAYELEPGNPDFAYSLARVRYDAGDYADAERLLQGVIEAEPAFIDACILLVGAQAGAGRLEDAALTCEAILAIDPKHFHALNILGDLCDRLGEPEKAARMRQRILAFMPGHAPSCESLMRYHLDRGEEEKAREYAARLLGMGIDLPEEIRARLGLE